MLIEASAKINFHHEPLLKTRHKTDVKWNWKCYYLVVWSQLALQMSSIVGESPYKQNRVCIHNVQYIHVCMLCPNMGIAMPEHTLSKYQQVWSHVFQKVPMHVRVCVDNLLGLSLRQRPQWTDDLIDLIHELSAYVQSLDLVWVPCLVSCIIILINVHVHVSCYSLPPPWQIASSVYVCLL